MQNVSNWVQCMILAKATPKERAEVVLKFVNVGKVRETGGNLRISSEKFSISDGSTTTTL